MKLLEVLVQGLLAVLCVLMMIILALAVWPAHASDCPRCKETLSKRGEIYHCFNCDYRMGVK